MTGQNDRQTQILSGQIDIVRWPAIILSPEMTDLSSQLPL